MTIDYRTKITCHRYSPVAMEAADVIEVNESNRESIVQSAALRRLQQKTQVYPLETNSGMRSRLTHSLEVKQAGRSIARRILARLHRQGELGAVGLAGMESTFISLVEMSCLLHDIGNPPFGHFGETVISQWLEKNALEIFVRSFGTKRTVPTLFAEKLLPDLICFEGNAQGLRIIHSLQQLNLTLCQIAAAQKYTRAAWQAAPDPGDTFGYRQYKPGYYYSETDLVTTLTERLNIQAGHRHPLVYIMESADDISYCFADIEDALDKEIFSPAQLVVHLLAEWDIQCQNAGVAPGHYFSEGLKRITVENMTTHVFMRRLRRWLLADMVDYAACRYLDNHSAVYNGELDRPLMDGPAEPNIALLTLKFVAQKCVFVKKEVTTPELRGHAALHGLLNIYRPLLDAPRPIFIELSQQQVPGRLIGERLYRRLPARYKEAYHKAVAPAAVDTPEGDALEWYCRARLLLDYLSGMTDAYALEEYQRLAAI